MVISWAIDKDCGVSYRTTDMTTAMADTIPADLRQLLQQTGLFTDVQISEVLTNQQTAAQPLITALVKSRVATEEKLLEALAAALHLPFTRITDKEIDAAARAEGSDESRLPAQCHADAAGEWDADRCGE